MVVQYKYPATRELAVGDVDRCPALCLPLQWYTLNDVKSGRVHLTLEWVPTATEPDRLDQVREGGQVKGGPGRGGQGPGVMRCGGTDGGDPGALTPLLH